MQVLVLVVAQCVDERGKGAIAARLETIEQQSDALLAIRLRLQRLTRLALDDVFRRQRVENVQNLKSYNTARLRKDCNDMLCEQFEHNIATGKEINVSVSDQTTAGLTVACKTTCFPSILTIILIISTSDNSMTHPLSKFIHA